VAPTREQLDMHTDASERRAREAGPRGSVLALAELEAVRLILRGGSVVDWFRLNFKTEDEAYALLRVLGVEIENSADIEHLARLRDLGRLYLENEHGYRVPDAIAQATAVDLFMYASAQKGRRRDRFFACLLLKVMHIVHHIRARELRVRLPLSQSDLGQMIMSRVNAFADELAADGFPLVEFAGGEKSEGSLITKLLVKKEHHAATIHDRVRFRFVVEKSGDIVPLLHRMTMSLLPFNYIVPGQSLNQLVNFTALIESHQAYRDVANELQLELGYEENTLSSANEFSGPSFHVVSFVADVPLRAPLRMIEAGAIDASLGPIVFALAEFQVVDEATAKENEQGENRHERYRDRQLSRVRARLERGLRGVGIDEL
jgi:uncharacterized protein (TIGR04552 family)